MAQVHTARLKWNGKEVVMNNTARIFCRLLKRI
ncbi:hypothetical protein ACNKHV_24390 [Shigella flexneri]